MMNDLLGEEGAVQSEGVVKKAERMEEFLGTLDGFGAGNETSSLDPCYLGYFECFNSQRYYEAHDVLEHLWLKEGREAPDYRFHKGLIQLAGGFVHLKLQSAHPDHPKHGRRLHPARRLFLLSIDNLAPYSVREGGKGEKDGARHHGLDLEIPMSLAQEMVALIEEGRFERNPWNPEMPPILRLPHH